MAESKELKIYTPDEILEKIKGNEGQFTLTPKQIMLVSAEEYIEFQKLIKFKAEWLELDIFSETEIRTGNVTISWRPHVEV